MSFKRMAVLSALLCGSVCPAQPQTLTNEQVNNFKRAILDADLVILLALCPEGYQLQPGLDVTCVLSLQILVDNMRERGDFGRSICLPTAMKNKQLFDAITEYIIVKKPLDTERATTIASIALREKFPCPRPLNFR